jgi:large subunit ribosomal protein L7/L12
MKQKTKNPKEVRIMADKKKETKKDLSKAVGKLVDEISKLTVVELSQLVDALQDTLGVSAMPVAAAPAGGAATEAEGEKEEVTGGANQTVVITGAGDNKIAVIKAIREINQNLGLKEAKDMTENLPAEILKDAKADDATAAGDKLKAAGATVELK